MKTPEELRAAASRYRWLVQRVTDEKATNALLELADEYEKLAVEAERIGGYEGIGVDDDS